MKLLFQSGFENLMYVFEVKMLACEKLGNDLGNLLMSFLKEDPVPWCWGFDEDVPRSPWDCCTAVDPCDQIDLPLFAP